MKIRIPALLLLTAVLLAGCNFSLAADVTPPPGYQPPPAADVTPQVTSGPLYPLVPPDPGKGAATYTEKCAPCHGPNGLGDGPQAANLPNPVAALGSSQIAHQAVPAEWYRVVTEGNLERFMPPFPSLNDRQRWDVVAYALTLSTPEQSLAQGAEIYLAECAACHGQTGLGDGPQAVEGTPNFTDQEQMANKSGNVLFQAISEGVDGKMPAYRDQLSEDQRWSLVAHVRNLTFAPSVAGGVQTTPEPGQASPAAGTPAGISTSVAGETLTTTQPLTATVLTTVRGTVVNASGGEPPAGLQVTLHGFDQMTLAITGTTELKADGTFVFENIEAPAGRAFLSTLEFEQVLYGSQVAPVETPGQPVELAMQVYETTADQSSLTADRLHFFFEFIDAQTLRVAELYIVSNNGKETVVGEGPGQPVLNFLLPKEAANLEFQDGELGDRYVETPNGFADTIPVRPGAGNYQVLFSYQLPYNRKLELSRPVSMPVQAVVILAPESSVTVRGPTIQDGGARDVQGVQYHTYNGAAMEAGSTLDLTISGSPTGSAASLLTAGTSSNLLIGAGALGLVLVLAGVWMYLRARSDDGAAASAGSNSSIAVRSAAAAETVAGQKESKESIMDAILALDDLYQDGTLPEDAYLMRRAELKERLVQLMEG